MHDKELGGQLYDNRAAKLCCTRVQSLKALSLAQARKLVRMACVLLLCATDLRLEKQKVSSEHSKASTAPSFRTVIHSTNTAALSRSRST